MSYKSKVHLGLNDFIVWKNFVKERKNLNVIDKYFKLYFNAKLLSWKCTFINTGVMEKCRICKSSFDFKYIQDYLFIIYSENILSRKIKFSIACKTKIHN